MTSIELLARLRHDILAVIADAKELDLLPESILNLKEGPAKWSVLECFEHLNRYSSYYHAEFRNAIAVAPLSDNTYEAKSTWMGEKFIAMMHPDNTKKHKTFPRMNPSHGSLKKDVIGRFLKNQEELLDILDGFSKIDLSKASIPVEFLKILRMNLGDALQFVVVHEQRHIKQALRARSYAERLLAPTLKI